MKCCMMLLMVRRKNACNFLYECESVLESGYAKCGCCDMNEEELVDGEESCESEQTILVIEW